MALFISTIGFVMRPVMYVTARNAKMTATHAESRTSSDTCFMESLVRLMSV